MLAISSRLEPNQNFLHQRFPTMRQSFFNEQFFTTIPAQNIEKKSSWKRTVIKASLNTFLFLGILSFAVYFLPQLTFKLFPNLNNSLIKAGELYQNENSHGSEQIILSVVPEMEATAVAARKIKPKYDLNAPAGQWLKIDSAGIDAEILTNQNIEDDKEVKKILDQGIYAYPEFNKYGHWEEPVILAGHHYNMLTSKKQNSQTFQNLDKVNIGDQVIITDNQKQWFYQIYKIEKATSITENEADLVMYTCIFWWDNDLRLFVYANLINEE